MTDISIASPATDDAIDTPAPATDGGGKSEIANQLRGALEGDKPVDSGSRRDQLRNQIDAELTKVTDAEKTPKVDAQADGRARGPDGKFVAKDPNAEPVAEIVSDDVVETPAASAIEPPAAWSKAVKEKWATLPPDVQAEIAKREVDVAKGFEKYQNLRSVEPVLDAISQAAPQYGLSTPQVIQSWANTQIALMNPATAPAEFARLAQAYIKPETLVMMARQILNGVPAPQQEAPAADPNVWVDPEVAALKQEIAQFKNWQQSLEQRDQIAAQQRIQADHNSKVSAIDKFAAEKDASGQLLRPHLDTVMPDMAASINRIRSVNPQLSDQDVLQQAYESAIWSNPDTRKQVLESQRLTEENERKAQARARAQAATRQAVSPASASPQGSPAPIPPKGSVRDQMYAAYEQLTT